jgi:Ankyrin repeats (3 copies)
MIKGIKCLPTSHDAKFILDCILCASRLPHWELETSANSDVKRPTIGKPFHEARLGPALFSNQVFAFLTLNSRMQRLPIELLYEVTQRIPLHDYINLRATNSAFLEGLKKVPTVRFEAYMESSERFQDLLQHHIRVQLSWEDLNDDSFLYLAEVGHAAEFTRILSSTRSAIISPVVKEQAVREVVLRDQSPQMIIALLKDGTIDFNMHVPFTADKIGNIENGTLLHWASCNGHIELLEYLLADPTTDVTFEDEVGCNALHLVCATDHLDVAAVLLRDGRLDPNSRNENGWVPLHYAAVNGLTAIAQLLLRDPRVDPCTSDIDGWQPIHFTSGFNQLDTLHLLLTDKRIDPLVRNNNGKRPIDIAMECKHIRIVNVLRSRSAWDTRRTANWLTRISYRRPLICNQ